MFVPAFTDSELGLDVALNNRLRESTGRHKLRFDPFEDLEHFAATLLRQTRLGIFTIGGGVPRNWVCSSLGLSEEAVATGGWERTFCRSATTMRANPCPEPVYWGADSPAVLTAKPFPGESLCLRQKAENLASCLWTQPSDFPWSSRQCWSAWARKSFIEEEGGITEVADGARITATVPRNVFAVFYEGMDYADQFDAPRSDWHWFLQDYELSSLGRVGYLVFAALLLLGIVPEWRVLLDRHS